MTVRMRSCACTSIEPGSALYINGLAAHRLVFDGSAETSGPWYIDGSAGSDDLRGGAAGEDFALLLDYVCEIPGIERVRYTTSHPREFTPRLIEAHARLEKLATWGTGTVTPVLFSGVSVAVAPAVPA